MIHNPTKLVLALVEKAKRVTAHEGTLEALTECWCQHCQDHIELRAAIAAWEARNA